MEIYAYPVFDRHGEVEQVIEYALDVTERKRMEEDLRASAEKIKLFAYAISHDIRNPLIGVHGLTRLLAGQYGHLLDEKGKKYCEQAVKASEKALSLVEDINNFIKSKELPLHCEKLDLRDIIRTIRSEFEPALSVRKIKWLEPPVALEFCADRRAIERVFRNFVENALKYGGEKLTEIDIEYSGSEQFHTFCVTDDGVGIEGEDLDGVFNMFQRQDCSNSIEGTGMGLAIVKEIAEKHKGKAWAARGRNGGATFCVSISKDLYAEPPAEEAA
jgi:light-regulated signal transduction histidine kinase (bacteriophytochrome)